MTPVSLTDAAAAKIKELLERQERRGHALRVRVVAGGCSGLQYELSFDRAVEEGDIESVEKGVRLLVDSQSALSLAGTSVDYLDELGTSGFKIINPNASSTCGCGESFNV